MIVRAAATWLPGGLARDVVVELDGPRITAVRPARAGDPPAHDGLLIPGTVNAHTHVELTAHAGAVPALQQGFPEWATRVRGLPPADPGGAWTGARALAEAGVALVGDVSNRGDTAAALAEAGLTGVVWRELLGLDARRWRGAVAEAEALDVRERAFHVRPAAHAVFSTAPELLRAALAPRGVPATIHVAEDPAEAEFLSGTGPWPALLDQWGIDWRWFTPPGGTPIAWLAALAALRSDVLLVHCVHLTDADRRAIRAADAPVVLCPRSNLHIGGRLPDVPALLAAGIRFALGTDSLASSPSLDPLDEIPVLAHAFPRVDPAVWLHAATAGGADVLGAPRHGRIAPGATPGLVLLAGARGPRDLTGPRIARTRLAPTSPAW